MLSLLTFPGSTTTIVQASEFANPLLQEFLPLIGIAFGIFVVFAILVYLRENILDWITWFIDKATGKKVEKNYYGWTEERYAGMTKKLSPTVSQTEYAKFRE